MRAREKAKSAAPGSVSGPALFSARRQKQPSLSLVSHGLDFGNSAWPEELRGVMDSLGVVRQRILANTFLRGWMSLWTWILAGLIVAAAFSPKLAWAVISAGVVATVGSIAVFVWTWSTRPSAYGAACRLDSAAGLHDRVSTAVHLGAAENPDGMILRQRQDAVARLTQVSSRALFRVRWPAAARRAVVLGVVAAGFFVYRMHYKPPLVALLETAARSQLVQSILAPMAHAMEKDLQRTIALLNSKPDAPADEVRSGDAAPAADDLWQASDEKANKSEDGQQNSQEANFSDDQKDQNSSPMPGGQGEMRPGDSQQEDGARQSQEGSSGGDRKAGDAQQQAEAQSSDNNSQSLPQSLMQALKNLLSNSPSQQQNNQANRQQSDSQGLPQSGNSRQPGSGEADKKNDSRGTSDAQQKASQNSSNGAGSQAGIKELKKDQAALAVKAVPERIALESTGFKEQMRVRAGGGTGAARLPVRDVSPQAVAVTNGAEQENIPARYRLYVQRYFEHPENGQK